MSILRSVVSLLVTGSITSVVACSGDPSAASEEAVSTSENDLTKADACGANWAEFKKLVNGKDATAFSKIFATNYQSEQPLNPEDNFVGNATVLAHWEFIYSALPDFHFDETRCSRDGDVVWSEQTWNGTFCDGSKFHWPVVSIVKFDEHGIVQKGSLYMNKFGAGIPACATQSP